MEDIFYITETHPHLDKYINKKFHSKYIRSLIGIYRNNSFGKYICAYGPVRTHPLVSKCQYYPELQQHLLEYDRNTKVQGFTDHHIAHSRLLSSLMRPCC